MTIEEAEQHNKEIMETPRWKGTGKYPLVLQKKLVERMQKFGVWDDIKGVCIISLKDRI